MVQTKHIILLFLALNACNAIVSGQTRIVAPVERAKFTHATTYDSLQAFLQLIAKSPRVRVEHIATTRLGRVVSAAEVSSNGRFGTDTMKLRILLFAQQHGDEPAGKEALTLLLAKLASSSPPRWMNRLDILIVPQMNPDGAEMHQRRTSDSIDLNRNHVLLTSPETKGLHDLFYKWKPEVTLDMHEYSSGKAWRDSGMLKTADVQLGMLTHPNTPQSIRHMQHQNVYPFISSKVERQGYRFQEYIVGSPDSRIRHSTTEINDGRQSFGILNSMSFIQEGRKWEGLDDTLKRRAKSQLASVEALLDYCGQHAADIRSMIAAERSRLRRVQGTNLVLRMEHVLGTAQSVIPVFNLRSNRDTVWNIAPYHSIVQPRLTIRIPAAYMVPRHLTSVLDLLRRHHITLKEISAERLVPVETCTLDSVGVEDVEETPMARAFVRWTRTTAVLRPGDILVPSNQLQSVFVSIVLEPESVWGLMSYPAFDTTLRKQGEYPIVRIEQ